MSEPVIVPPPPTVTQPSKPGVDNSPGLDVVQKVFDRVLPEKGKKSPSPTPETPTPPVPPLPTQLPLQGESKQPQQPTQTEAPPATENPPEKPQEVDVPSFLEKALRGETDAPPAPPAATEEEWPEELPTFKNSEEAKERYRKWRVAHKALRDDLAAERNKKPVPDPTTSTRVQELEQVNRQLQETLSRFGVEQSAEFQQSVIAPLYASWNEASRIVKENGGDPQSLARAMSVSGRAQFEALDSILEEMPESARMQINDALRTYRHYDGVRRDALQNAPKTMEGIRRREAERQLGEINKQRKDMESVFETAVKRLRDDAKLEVLLHTDMPEGSWWNDQGEKIINQARDLYLENTDINRVAMACLLAPSADAYRRLWLNSQKKIGELQKVINERVNNEPNLSENGGPGHIVPSEQQFKEDLNRPFHEVFLREFHNSQARNR